MSICIVLAVVFGVLLGLVYSNRDVIFKNNKETEVSNNNNNINNENKLNELNIEDHYKFYENQGKHGNF